LRLKAEKSLGIQNAQKLQEILPKVEETLKPKGNIIIMSGKLNEPVS
jgi:hypothetical protein